MKRKLFSVRPLIMWQLSSWSLHFITEKWMKSVRIITLLENSTVSQCAVFYYCEARYLIWHLIKAGHKKKDGQYKWTHYIHRNILWLWNMATEKRWGCVALNASNGDVLQQTWWLLRTLSITLSFFKHNILETGSVSTVGCKRMIKMISF
jgi:hypothetical protein